MFRLERIKEVFQCKSKPGNYYIFSESLCSEIYVISQGYGKKHKFYLTVQGGKDNDWVWMWLVS